jgi:hypothetical protein
VFSVALTASWATAAAVCRTSIGNRLIGGRRAAPATVQRALPAEQNQPVR